MQVNFQSLDQGNTSSGIYSTWRCVFLRSLTAINMICRYAFFPGCLNVMDVYEVNNVCENEGEGCLEESDLGEFFRGTWRTFWMGFSMSV